MLCQVTLATIREAYQIVAPVARQTPLLSSTYCSEQVGYPVIFKLENLQRTGSFKIRGAYYKLSKLAQLGTVKEVMAISAGNHAQGVALASNMTGISATIFMPEEASLAKIQATQNYGAQVICSGGSFEEAKQHAMTWLEDHPVPFISPFDDDDIIAGQGTLGLEILDQLPEVQTVVIPVGGGGLIGGTALALKHIKPEVRIIGVQAKAAPTLYTSFHKHQLTPMPGSHTIADGIAIKQPGQRNFELIERYVDDMVLVNEEEIIQALFFCMYRKHVIVEGAGVVGLAALLNGKIQAQGPTLVVLSGGNIDLRMIDAILNKGMAQMGRLLTIRSLISDQPGSLRKVLDLCAKHKASVLNIQHSRFRSDIPLGFTAIEVELDIRDKQHAEDILMALAKKGYTFQQV